MNKAYRLGVVLLLMSLLAVAGFARLHRVFVNERDASIRAIELRRDALVAYAKQDFSQRLEQAFDRQRKQLRLALSDPLQSANGLVVAAGQQLLPRRWVEPAATNRPSILTQLRRKKLSILMDEESSRDPQSPWLQRLKLLATMGTALAANDAQEAVATLIQIFSHRGAYQLQAERDLAVAVHALEALNGKLALTPAFWEKVLRDGLPGTAQDQPGLQRQLLGARTKLTASVFRQLAEAIRRLCRRHAVSSAAFEARVEEKTAPDLVQTLRLAEPAVVGTSTRVSSDWYLRFSTERIEGMRIDLTDYAQAVAESMKRRGLLQGDEAVAIRSAGAMPLQAVDVRIQSARWLSMRQQAQQGYRLKTGLEVVVLFLFIGIIALLYFSYDQRRRVLDSRGKFVEAVSHELRTPLAAMRAMAETIERRTKGNAKLKDYPARIVRAADGLGLLVENILSFNRVDKGRWLTQPSQVRVAGVVERLAEGVRATSARPVVLVNDVEQDLCLRVDRDLFGLLMSNLLHNSVKYCENEAVHIRLYAGVHQHRFCLWVQDNGRGIHPQDQPRVFEDFYRGPAGSVRGSGLGLSICDRIMKAHGGGIVLESSDAQGSCFRLEFPLQARANS